MFYCVHPVASRLLGGQTHPPSYILGPSATSIDRWSSSDDACMDATEEAISLFKQRNDVNFRKIEPIVPRLASAVTRRGRFAEEDRILDVAMALERMYDLDQGEISFKLKIRAACFLESTTEGRTRVFKDVKALYDLRSAIVHGNKKGLGSKHQQETVFRMGFDIANRTLVKLVHEGLPANWNHLVIAGTDARPSALPLN